MSFFTDPFPNGILGANCPQVQYSVQASHGEADTDNGGFLLISFIEMVSGSLV